MPKVKLTAPWRGHQPGDIVDVTPGQRTMVLTLRKGRDYVRPKPKTKKTTGKKTQTEAAPSNATSS